MALSGLQRAVKLACQVGLPRMALYGLYKVGLMTGHYRRLTDDRRPPTDENGLPTTVHGLFTLPNHDQLAEILGEDGQRTLISQADEIVDGKFRMFGGEPVEIKLTFDRPLQHWTKYETDPQLLADLCSSVSDIKFIWEPARFGWSYILGRAYYLTQNETYAETFWKYFECFTDGNPPNLGPHWMNGQEVAIRLMALVWAGQVFGTPPIGSGETPSRR